MICKSPWFLGRSSHCLSINTILSVSQHGKILLIKKTLTLISYTIFSIVICKILHFCFILFQHWRRVCTLARRRSNISALPYSTQVWEEPGCPCTHCASHSWETSQVGRASPVTPFGRPNCTLTLFLNLLQLPYYYYQQYSLIFLKQINCSTDFHPLTSCVPIKAVYWSQSSWSRLTFIHGHLLGILQKTILLTILNVMCQQVY